MSKKNLLNESTIRKFMKLASIEPLASDFISKIQEAEEQELEEAKHDDDLEEGRDKEEVDEAKHDDDLEEGRDKEEVDEAKHDDDLEERGGTMPPAMDRDDDDMDLGMDAEEPAAGAGGMVSVDQLMAALEKALEDVLGQEVEVSQDEDDMDMDLDLDAADDDEDMMEMEEEGIEESDETEVQETKKEVEIAEAVYRKVLQRLAKEK